MSCAVAGLLINFYVFSAPKKRAAYSCNFISLHSLPPPHN